MEGSRVKELLARFYPESSGVEVKGLKLEKIGYPATSTPPVIHTGAEHEGGGNRLIRHPIVDSLGPTTNVLIHALFLSRRFEELTREDVRKALEDHKDAMSEMEPQIQLLSRVRDGKATVNFWIDRLVESKILDKRHSNPVQFWLNEEHQFNNTLQGLEVSRGVQQWGSA